MRFLIFYVALALGSASAFAQEAGAEKSLQNCIKALDCKCSIYRMIQRDICEWFDRQRVELQQIAEHVKKERAKQEEHQTDEPRLYQSYEVTVDSRADGKGRARQPATSDRKRVAILYAYGKKEILVIHGQYDTGSVSICEATTPLCQKIRDALSNLASRKLPAWASGWRVEIWGTADIAGAPDAKNYVSESVLLECQKQGWISNDCIAYARAVDMEAELRKHYSADRLTLVDLSIDSDPFMRTLNRRLNDTLFPMLKIETEVRDLMGELEIPPDWAASQIRLNSRLQAKVKQLNNLESRLAPFRSVVVMVEPCSARSCSK